MIEDDNQYKSYRNELSTLMKQSKKQCYSFYFINNIKHVIKNWKETKSIVSLKASISESPKTIINTKDGFLTNPKDFSNSNFFCSVATNIQCTTKQTSNFFLIFQLTLV